MQPSRPSLLLIYPRPALILSWILFVGLAGCGSAPSENIPTLGSSAPQGDPPISQQNLSPQTNLFASYAGPAVASPDPHAWKNEAGSMPGNGTSQIGDHANSKPVTSNEPLAPQDALDVPAWFAKDLASPHVETRLRALEIWVASAPIGSIDPLILAFENDEELVRARAMELVVQEYDDALAADLAQ